MFHFRNKSARSLVLLICIFIGLDFCMLGLNLFLSSSIEKDTQEVNLAGRQRMLTQAIAKSTHHWIESIHSETSSIETTSAQLLAYARLFDTTLRAFKQGGTVTGTQGQRIEIRQVDEQKQIALIQEAETLWNQWREKLHAALLLSPTPAHDIAFLVEGLPHRNDTSPSLRSPLLELETVTKYNNEKLLSLMNELTTTLEQHAKKHVKLIRFYQQLTFFLALLNFIIIIRQFFSHLALSKQSQRILERIVHSVDTSIIITDTHDCIVNANHTAEVYFEKNEASLKGHRLQEMLSLYKNDCYEIKREKSTEKRYARVFQQEIEINEQAYIICTISDMTVQIETEQSLSELAYQDQLTGLSNRKMTEDRLEQEIKKSLRYNEDFCVLYLDLDGFKQINDSFGHDTGDTLLVNVAQALKQELRSSDTIGRLGGDEFLLICPNMHTKEEASALSLKILQAIINIDIKQSDSASVSTSIGIAFFPSDATDSHTLCQLADKAMYQAKNEGKNKYCFAVSEIESPITLHR